jgi:Flp pilus assembly protein TadG
MMNRLATLRSDDRGASIIELALIAPLFAAFLVGMVDLARAYSFRLNLEQSVQRSVEKVMQYQENTSTYSTLKSEAANAAAVPETSVTVDYWLECNGTRQADYDTTCPTGQAYARFVTVSVFKKFRPMFGTKYFPRANTDGTYTIRTTAGLRTQ